MLQIMTTRCSSHQTNNLYNESNQIPMFFFINHNHNSNKLPQHVLSILKILFSSPKKAEVVPLSLMGSSSKKASLQEHTGTFWVNANGLSVLGVLARRDCIPCICHKMNLNKVIHHSQASSIPTALVSDNPFIVSERTDRWRFDNIREAQGVAFD